MGSFVGHLFPGSLFLLIGLWHIGNSIVKYLGDPQSFRARVWHAVPGRLKHLELYIITVGSFVDMCLEFFYSTHLRFVVDGALNSAHMNDFEHAAMLLMFFLFGASALVSETTRYVTDICLSKCFLSQLYLSVHEFGKRMGCIVCLKFSIWASARNVQILSCLIDST
ncbi:hypothetical protein GOP47_0009588 [Adiantum capillus-veneris]|uniref:Transmembrane protein 45B n=1 Tax=Adiantum capillus-veneris TaxID=13818 RepID=A0A9D4UXD6_ADICA|nr:hypothetical protein GOP47_0009588 [Adiantum capillus-veneris]